MQTASWGDLFRDGRAVYSVSLALGIALHAMDSFVVSTVMPTVVRDIGGSAFYAWVVMLYMTASIVGSASAGPVKAALGRKRGYAVAGIIFLIGTMIGGLAPSMDILLLARVVQGFGVGLLVSQNTALISELFPGPLRPRMIALTSTMWATSAILGPLIGGLFAEIHWWRGAFWFAVPIIIGFTALTWIKLPDSTTPPVRRRFPVGRVAMLGIGVFVVGTTGVLPEMLREHVGETGLPDLLVRAIALAAGFGLVGLTVRLDAGAESRVFPSRPFSISYPVGTAYWAFLLIGMAPVCLGIYMPLAYQTIYGLPPLLAGYFSAAFAVFWSIGSTVSAGFPIERQRVTLVLGPCIVTVAVAAIGWMIGQVPFYFIALATCLGGFGIGICMSHLMNWTMTLARPGEESITATTIHTIRSLGIAFGAAGAGVIANMAGLGRGIGAETVQASVHSVELVAAAAPAVGALLTFHLLGQRRRHEHAPATALPKAAE